MVSDNIFSIKSWTKKKFSFDEKRINKAFGIPEDFDYLDWLTAFFKNVNARIPAEGDVSWHHCGVGIPGVYRSIFMTCFRMDISDRWALSAETLDCCNRRREAPTVNGCKGVLSSTKPGLVTSGTPVWVKSESLDSMMEKARLLIVLQT